MLLLTFLASFVEKVWHWLDQADKQLFLKINTQWTNSSLDDILPWYRDSNTWIPFIYDGFFATGV